MNSSDICGGYKVVAYRIGEETACVRHLFIKSHEGTSDTKPSEKTLFILNVPQFLNRKCLKFMYKHCGKIVNTFIHQKPKNSVNEVSDNLFSSKEPDIGYKVAYVVFEDPSGLKAALKCEELPHVPKKLYSNSVGLNKWIRDYNSKFLDVSKTSEEINAFMANFDQKKEEEKHKAENMEVDEEGWITVSKLKKKSKATHGKRVTKRLIEKQKKDIEKRTLLNFYRCQLRDAKMERMLELQKKFDKDKERISLMKANRKFKPF